ncbi:hypothetical protein ACPPVQ_03795 [Diaminobutyricibacter sp. McL0618]|uniref:hypothetical protein n=1 Tax=Leifsonia sp. McL0618 TaxID=3415677 RepID=UPI003CE8F0B0
MTTTTQDATFVDQTATLRAMAECLKQVAIEKPNSDISELLRLAGERYGTTPSQMKYALSFAGVKKLVRIDYDSATVSATTD